MSKPPPAQMPLTELLVRVEGGDRAALEELFSLVYRELHRLARIQRGRLPSDDTLATTALVHEAYLKLAGARALSARDRHHFFSLAARAMRQILVDHLRRRGAQRRPDPGRARALEDVEIAVAAPVEELLAIDAALSKLERLDPGLGRLVEWRVFAGLTLAEIGPLAERSPASLKRDWQKARAFLARELGARAPAPGAGPAGGGAA